MNTDPTPHPAATSPGDALHRSFLKKAWRFVFWPFYRHFDILHLEIESLKAGEQSTRILYEQSLQRHLKAQEANIRALAELATDLRRQDDRTSHLENRLLSTLKLCEALQSRQEESSDPPVSRGGEIAVRLAALEKTGIESARHLSELARGLDQLRLETRPKLHQFSVALAQLRDANAAAAPEEPELKSKAGLKPAGQGIKP